MSDKIKQLPAATSKNVKAKRPATVSNLAPSSRTRVPQSTVKDKNVRARPKINKNTTVIGDADQTLLKLEGQMPDFDAEQRQIAYGKFLRTMLEECLVDEKIEREETIVDIQMTQLAERFQKTIEHLDKTNKRIKDISFVAEQNRLMSLKSQNNEDFYKTTDEANASEILQGLNRAEAATLDKLHTKNIDFGYNKVSGHKQLLDAVNDAIDGLEQIKKFSNLDIEKLKQYERSQTMIDNVEKDRMDLDSLKSEFESKFPNFGERLMKEASDRINKMMGDDLDDE